MVFFHFKQTFQRVIFLHLAHVGRQICLSHQTVKKIKGNFQCAVSLASIRFQHCTEKGLIQGKFNTDAVDFQSVKLDVKPEEKTLIKEH